MSNVKNLIGERFGYLTVLERAENTKSGKAQWLCQCDCGNVTVLPTYRLTGGITKSCGCKKFESHNRRHGMTKTDLYNKWLSMRQRCNDLNCKSYPKYGGRGISVCTEWNRSFEKFAEWSFSHGYKDGLSLDRIDNDKGYSPENCRWISWKGQCNNRRNNILITRNGETKTLHQWCECLGLNYQSVYQRMKRYGYTFEQAAFSKPYELRGK